jgi:hypothetical protein
MRRRKKSRRNAPSECVATRIMQWSSSCPSEALAPQCYSYGENIACAEIESTSKKRIEEWNAFEH